MGKDLNKSKWACQKCGRYTLLKSGKNSGFKCCLCGNIQQVEGHNMVEKGYNMEKKTKYHSLPKTYAEEVKEWLRVNVDYGDGPLGNAPKKRKRSFFS